MRQEYPTEVRKWDVFEVALEGPEDGKDVFKGVFSNKNESVVVEGFYDGDGVYRIRFMPSYEGRYTFILKGGFLENNLSGVFYATKSDEDNHGLVRVNGTHFAYEDGTPFNCVATTSNVWHLQNLETIEETISFLENNKLFNKVRFTVVPFEDSLGYPYNVENNKLGNFDPEYFQKLEKAVKRLGDIGVEADLVFFTASNDLWTEKKYDIEKAKELVKYTVNRLSAYHNVWWSLANDYDAIPLTSKDWVDLANIVISNDPYKHLRSIENSRVIYDYNHNWTTHCSIKQVDYYKGVEETDVLIERFNKPVVYEDFGFEGNLEYGWGNIPKEEILRRVWETTLRGGYPSYSEARDVNGKQWWLQGGKINSSNVKAIKLLNDLIKDKDGLTFMPYTWDELCAVSTSEEDAEVKSEYLFYYSFMAPGKRTYYIDDETDYLVEVIDTVNAEVYRQGIHKGEFEIELPEKPYVAVRLSLPTEEDYANPYAKFEVEEEEEAAPVLVEEETVEEVSDTPELIEEVLFEEPEVLEEEFEEEEEEEIIPDVLEDTDEFDLEEIMAADGALDEDIEEEFEEEVDEVEDIDDFLEEPVLLEDTEEMLFGNAVSRENIETLAEDRTLELPISHRRIEDEDELPDIVTASIPVITAEDEEELELEDLRREPIISIDEEESHIPSIEETLNIMFMNRNRKGDE